MVRRTLPLLCTFALACGAEPARSPSAEGAPAPAEAAPASAEPSTPRSAELSMVEIDHECSEPLDPATLDEPNLGFARTWTVPPCDVDCPGPQKRCGICIDGSDAAATEAAYAAIDDQYRAFAWTTFIAFHHPMRPDVTHGPERAKTWQRWPRDERESGTAELDPVAARSCGLVDEAQLARLVTPSWERRPELGASVDIPEHQPLVPSVAIESPGSVKILDYDVMFNEPAIEFLSRYGLDTREGQARHLLGGAGGPPWGRYDREHATSRRPPTVVKLVYARLPEAARGACEAGRCPYLLDPEDPALALIAMHITANLYTANGLWVWATFEHVDVLTEFFAEDPKRPGHTNECPAPGGHTHIERAPSNQAALEASRPLNEKFQALLRDMDGLEALAHYQLIGVQHPQESCSAPCERGQCPGDSALQVRPTLLSNTVIEWDRQRSSCVGCHSHATVWAPSMEHLEALCADAGKDPLTCAIPRSTLRGLTFAASELAPRWYRNTRSNAGRMPASHFLWFLSKTATTTRSTDG